MISHIKQQQRFTMVRAIGLLSGGLDSILAVRVMQEQGIHVIAVCFVTPFFGPEKAQMAARQLGLDLQVIDITDVYLTMLKKPRYGYGRNMNPCIDCHGLMFREAGLRMNEYGAQFLFSGEVVGERPMSQNKNSLRAVEKLSGFQGYILRPLSAQLLPKTIPEQEGLVDRSRLLAFSGRSRKPQIELARRFGITSYPEPAGGCKLTEPGFSNRLRDLINHTTAVNRHSLELLKIGRHLRLTDRVKVIIGRNKKENDTLRSMAGDQNILLWAHRVPGPVALVDGEADEYTIMLAAAVCARYSDTGGCREVMVRVRFRSTTRTVMVRPASDTLIRNSLI